MLKTVTHLQLMKLFIGRENSTEGKKRNVGTELTDKTLLNTKKTPEVKKQTRNLQSVRHITLESVCVSVCVPVYVCTYTHRHTHTICI